MRSDPDNGIPLEPTRDLLILEDSVVKRRQPALSRVEYEKSRRAREIGLDSGLFVVPRIHSFDEERGVIEFERILDSKPLKTVLSAGRYPIGLLDRLGRSLATVHTRLTLPEEAIAELPSAWRDADAPNAFIHGDLNVTNVQYVADSDTLVLLDWAGTGTICESATYGPVYFDLAWFIHTMMFRRILGTEGIPEVRSKAEQFLAGYEAERPLDRRQFGHYLLRTWDNVSGRHRRKKGALRYALYRPALSRLRAYANSLIR